MVDVVISVAVVDVVCCEVIILVVGVVVGVVVGDVIFVVFIVVVVVILVVFYGDCCCCYCCCCCCCCYCGYCCCCCYYDLNQRHSFIPRWPKLIVIYDQDMERSLVEKMQNYPVVIFSNGTNSMKAEVTTVTACTLDTRFFPNDVQKCQIKLAPTPLDLT